MLLAIRGNINNVYKLSKNENKLIEPYLKGISHKRFPKNKLEQACTWANIELVKEYPKFTQLENKLNESGYISETDKIIAIEEPKNVKTPGEIDFDDIEPSECTNCREYFLGYIFAGGNCVPHCEFKGKMIFHYKKRDIRLISNISFNFVINFSHDLQNLQ